jgi:hypothetical protein
MRAILLGLLVAVVLVAGACPRERGRRHRRPRRGRANGSTRRRNIHCRWFWNEGLIACITQNNGRMVAVTTHGRPYMRWGTAGRSFPAGPTLTYGDRWTGYDGNNTSAIRCWSRGSGMTCKSLFTGRGFWIATEGYRLY